MVCFYRNLNGELKLLTLFDTLFMGIYYQNQLVSYNLFTISGRYETFD